LQEDFVKSQLYCAGLAAWLLLSAPFAFAQAAPEVPATTSVATPVGLIVQSIDDPALADLVVDVLDHNPELVMLRAKASAASQVAPQARSLPDPMAMVTAFVLTPETRVGPQQLMASLSQRFPWFGKLDLRERAAILGAAAARADVEAKRLALVTETRRLYYEIAFLDTWSEIVRLDRSTLSHYEELVRARYATGMGLEQSVVKIQAEITRDDRRLLEIATRRSSVVASLNALRAKPGEMPIATVTPVWPNPVAIERESWRSTALASRPELTRADAEIERGQALVDLAGKATKPDVTLGLTYTLVGGRDDAAGRMNPPQGNGNDILGISAGVNLPIWRRKIDAGIEEAIEKRHAAEASRRAIVASIDGALGELGERLDLNAKEIDLDQRVLTVQAEQALDSAEAGYRAGSVGALDLLDAERTLLAVRTATARARADYAISLAKLEGTIAAPLASQAQNGETDHE